MSIYDDFTKMQKIANCNRFVEIFDELVIYMKMSGESVEFDYDAIFNWMGMIDSSDYGDDEIEEDIVSYGNWDENDLSHIKNKLHELLSWLRTCLDDFEKKTGVTVYFEYDHYEYFAYFDFRSGQVFDLIVELSELKSNSEKEMNNVGL